MSWKKKIKKLQNNKDSILFNQTGLNEKILLKYTFIQIYLSIYLSIYSNCVGCL